MASDPYRPPNARLEDPRRERLPRSLLVAVLLGFLAERAITVAARLAAPQVWDTQWILTVVGGGRLGWRAR